MAETMSERVDWRALWGSGDLFRFTFISCGILLHATNETMVATIMPAMESPKPMNTLWRAMARVRRAILSAVARG